MTKTRSELTLPVALAVGIPPLVLRVGFGFLRVKAKRRRGVRAFRQALVQGGMRREQADRLAAEYESYGRLRTYLGDGRVRPFRFRL